MKLKRQIIFATGLLLICINTAKSGGIEDGIEAYKQGHYDKALAITSAACYSGSGECTK